MHDIWGLQGRIGMVVKMLSEWKFGANGRQHASGMSLSGGRGIAAAD